MRRCWGTGSTFQLQDWQGTELAQGGSVAAAAEERERSTTGVESDGDSAYGLLHGEALSQKANNVGKSGSLGQGWS